MQPKLSIESPQVVVLGEGPTEAARSNAKGHLFERFVARLFEAHGCVAPTINSVNVRAAGIELDITTSIVLTGEPAIAECKAYSSRVDARLLAEFYGKLNVARFASPSMHGWFVALPALTADGTELARSITEKDKRFRLFTAVEVFAYAHARGWIADAPHSMAHSSDRAVLLTAHGLFSCAKELDSKTRMACRVQVWGDGATAVPDPVIGLLRASEYADGLPVVAAGGASAEPSVVIAEPKLVRVVGSQSDFEYQFPASPRFFVGRERELAEFGENIGSKQTRGRVLVLNAQSGWGKSSLALRMADAFERAGGYAAVFDARTAASPSYVWGALRAVADGAHAKNVIKLPENAAFGSFRSALETFRRSEWTKRAGIFLFFDQFENVFRDVRLTQEFRDLALSVIELEYPMTVGFAWKTDLVGWTEDHPYLLRDEIRSAANVVRVVPFGPTEVGTVLSRLGKEVGRKLSGDLRQRVREYSQGLPWLLKKLASHIRRELLAGISEEALLQESLNIQGLFERDLAEVTVQVGC